MTHELIIFDHIYTPLASKGRVAGLREFKEMENAFKNGQAVYVQFVADQGIHRKRLGSIARVLNYTTMDYFPDYHLSGFPELHCEIKVGWDDNRKTSTLRSNEFFWLPDHTGDTFFRETIPEKPAIPELKDQLGCVIKVGDFVSYILYGQSYDGAAGIFFGTITNITTKGKVYAKNLKIGNVKFSEEKLIRNHNQIVIITNDLMDQLVLAKLSG